MYWALHTSQMSEKLKVQEIQAIPLSTLLGSYAKKTSNPTFDGLFPLNYQSGQNK